MALFEHRRKNYPPVAHIGLGVSRWFVCFAVIISYVAFFGWSVLNVAKALHRLDI